MPDGGDTGILQYITTVARGVTRRSTTLAIATRGNIDSGSNFQRFSTLLLDVRIFNGEGKDLQNRCHPKACLS